MSTDSYYSVVCGPDQNTDNLDNICPSSLCRGVVLLVLLTKTIKDYFYFFKRS